MSSTLKVVSLNLWADDLEKERRADSLLKFIKESSPEVLLLQENSAFNKEISVTQFLAEKSGYSFNESPGLISSSILYKGKVQASGVLDISKAVDFNLVKTASSPNYFPYILLDRGCHKVLLLSIHLPWGPREHLRLQSIYNLNLEITRLMEKFNPEVVIIGGDFNTNPNSDTIRFLEGSLVYNEGSTLWVNSAKTLDLGDVTTSNIDNPYAKIVASSVGIDELSEVKNRTIDYQFTHGYAYGKIGYPLKVEFKPNLVDGEFLSDHLGISVEYRC